MTEGKFLNSEQAKAEDKDAKVAELEKQVEMLQRRIQAMSELLGQYALQKAELELQLKEKHG